MRREQLKWTAGAIHAQYRAIHNCGCTSPYEFVGAQRVHTDQNERNVISSSAPIFKGFRSREKRHRDVSYDDVWMRETAESTSSSPSPANRQRILKSLLQQLNDGRTDLFVVVAIKTLSYDRRLPRYKSQDKVSVPRQGCRCSGANGL